MNVFMDKIIADALDLPREARALLAEKLLESLDVEEDFPVSEAWRAEVQRRCRELEGGKVTAIEAEEAFARARARLGQ